jgi:hypothetical protein
MKYWHPTLFTAAAIGAIFTPMSVAAWVDYAWGDGNGERAAFLSGVAVFAGPLLAGAVLAWRGRRSGLWLLRFGSVMCHPYPPVWWGLWNLGNDPEYLQLVADNDRRRGERVGRRGHQPPPADKFACGWRQLRPDRAVPGPLADDAGDLGDEGAGAVRGRTPCVRWPRPGQPHRGPGLDSPPDLLSCGGPPHEDHAIASSKKSSSAKTMSAGIGHAAKGALQPTGNGPAANLSAGAKKLGRGAPGATGRARGEAATKKGGK